MTMIPYADRKRVNRWIIESMVPMPIHVDDPRLELMEVAAGKKTTVFGGPVLYAGEALEQMCRWRRVTPTDLPIPRRVYR